MYNTQNTVYYSPLYLHTFVLKKIYLHDISYKVKNEQKKRKLIHLLRIYNLLFYHIKTNITFTP